MRPAIDALFRSAALHYGERVIAGSRKGSAMKLRLGEDTVRVRLSAEEVLRLLEEERLEERLCADPARGGQFTWAVELRDAAGDGGNGSTDGRGEALELRLEADGLTILLPAAVARRWAESKAIGLGADHPMEDGGRLRVLVEKDLPCGHAPAATDGDPPTGSRTVRVLRRGIEAALVASVPQVLVAKLEERLFLPSDETADIGPRFVEELGRKVERNLGEDEKWLAASAFHFGYATFWGALYSLLHERRPVHPALGGLALGGFIWLITFPHWGGAVLTGSERHPRDRSLRMELVMVSAALTFGMGTALLYGRGPDRDGSAAGGASPPAGGDPGLRDGPERA